MAEALLAASAHLVEREGLVERANGIGERLSSGLQSLADDGSIDHIRGVGAVWGAEMAPGVDTAAVRRRMLEAGVIVRPLNGTLVMCPPLVLTDEEIDRVVDVMAAAIG